MRRSKKGWPPIVKVGYSRQKAKKGLHPSGRKEVVIRRPKDLEKLDSRTQVARIAHTVGERKRVLILDQAKKLNITIVNPSPKKAPEPEVVTEPTHEETSAEKQEPAETSDKEEEENSKSETSEAGEQQQ